MLAAAILGYGTVGSGTAELLVGSAGHIEGKAALPVNLKYVLDVRDFPGVDLPFVKDFSIIENDPEVRVVVEAIGGVGIAYDFTRRALMAGKNVVTSNKELVAEHGAELLALARSKNLNYLFEGSVGGGIPIIRPLSQCLAANRIGEISGILNGTTNYILTEMEASGLEFAEALEQARRLGYAELDPSDDVDGKDACRKICILSSLSFGRHMYPKYVKTEGIRAVTHRQIELAGEAGFRIKLIGRAKDTPDGVAVIVAPHLVSADNPLYSVLGVYNGIMVDGDAIGRVMFYGKGAGKLPTASAVVADVIDCAKHLDARKYLDWADSDTDITADEDAFDYIWHSFPDGSKMRMLP